MVDIYDRSVTPDQILEEIKKQESIMMAADTKSDFSFARYHLGNARKEYLKRTGKKAPKSPHRVYVPGKPKKVKPYVPGKPTEKPKKIKRQVKSKVVKDKNSPSHKAAYQKERRALINKYFK